MDENKRHIVLTPRTVTGTPSAGILDLTTLVTSNRLMIDKLHLGFIYNAPRTFVPIDVSTAADNIMLVNHGFTSGLLINFSSSGTLPAPLISGTDYYVLVESANTFWVLTDPNDEDSIVDLTTQGTGTHTVSTPDQSDSAPLIEKINQNFAALPMCFANSNADKFWWLVGTSLYAFDGEGNPITTALQFNVPFRLAVSDFNSNSAINEMEDDLIDIVTELIRDTEAEKDNE